MEFVIILFLIIYIIPVNIILLVLFGYIDYHKKRFYLLKWLLIIDAIVFVALVVIFLSPILSSNPPSGKELSERYYQNKSEFHNLVKRIAVDEKKGLERIDSTWTRPDDVASIGLSEKDVKNYRKELKRLEMPRGFYAGPDGVTFLAYTFGLSISGSSKGYEYTTKTPRNYFKGDCDESLEPLKDLDAFKGCGGQSYRIYQQIDKNWYIFEDVED